jgi:hypothetical protein
VSLIFLEGFVKPLIFGTATGIACAEFSGLGRGFDGFTPRYFRGLAEAVLANIAYQAGTYLFAFVGSNPWRHPEHPLGPADPRRPDPADPQHPARRPDGGGAGAVGADRWHRRGWRPGVLRPVRDAAAGARGLLQRLWHGRPGTGQGS